MADKVKLFEIDIDTNAAYQEAAKLREEISKLKDKQSELAASAGKNSVEYAKVTAEIKALSSELRTNENLTSKTIQADKIKGDTIEKMRLTLAAVTIEWTKLTEAGLQDSKRGQELNKQKLELTETLKKLEGATGDNRRNVGNYSGAVKDLKLELRELKGILLSTKEGTEENNRALERAAQIQFELREINEKVKGSSKDVGDVIGNVTGTVRAFSAGLEVATGIEGLFGVKSEEFEKTLLKIQGAMALTQGLKDLDEGGKAFGRLLTQIKTFSQGVNKALLATGIGAFIALIGTIAAYWDDIKAAVTGVSKELDQNYQIGKKSLASEQKKLDTLNAQDNVLKLQGKTEKEIIQLKLKAIDAVIKEAEIQYQTTIDYYNARVKSEEEYQGIASKTLRFITAGIDGLLKGVDLLGKVLDKDWKLSDKFNKWSTSFIFDPEQVAEEGKKAVEEAQTNLTKLKNDRAGFEIEIQNINKKSSDASDKARDKELEAAEKFGEAQGKLTEKFLKDSEEARKKNVEKAIAAFELELQRYRETQAEKVKTLQDAADLEAEIATKDIEKRHELGLVSEVDYRNKLKEINDKFHTEITNLNSERDKLEYNAKYEAAKNDISARLDLERQSLEAKYAQDIEYANKIGADTTYIEQNYSDARKEIDRLEQEAKYDMAANFAGNIATLFGQQTAIGKAAAVAQTTINTWKGAQAAFADTPGGIIIKSIAAAAAVAVGLQNIKNILKVKSGLPGENSVSTSVAVSSSGSNVSNVPANITPSVNQGIVSRETGLIQNQSDLSLQPTLVIDDVTNKQLKNSSNNKTKTI